MAKDHNASGDHESTHSHLEQHRHEDHHRTSLKKQILLPVLIFAFLAAGTAMAILYGSGYRFGLDTGGKPQLSKTGILNAQSVPNGANVWVNDHLTSATNNSINLTPGQYKVSIGKDGYHGWSKNVSIQKETVTSTDARLWPAAPTLQSLSTFGIQDPVMDPTGSKLAFKIINQNAAKNGIYVLDMTTRTFPVLIGQSTSTQVTNDTVDNFSTAELSWSPDGEELIASVSSELTLEPTYYLLQAATLNETPQDITLTIDAVREVWETQRTTKDQARINTLRPQVRRLLNEHFDIIAWSPDETKILYQAKKTAELPVIITPRRIGNNWLYERRDLVENHIYVYNIQEDVNTRIFETGTEYCDITDESCENRALTWFPDSNHLIYVNERKINIVEDDGANMTTVYAGPFEDHFVFPWPDASRLVILTNLGNTGIPPTLYSVSLR